MKKLFFILTLLHLYTFMLPRPASAQSTDLTQFIAGPNFIEHLLSTGETIRFTNQGTTACPGGSSPARMYKNNNYEQYCVGSSGVFRQEDTSWAPLPGFQDAHCLNGDRAIYTLDPGCTKYSEGQIVSGDGTLWAIPSASVGQTWNTQVHQIVTIDSVKLANNNQKNYCTLVDLSGYSNPAACNQSNTILFAQFIPANSGFRFCTGIENPEDMIKLQNTGGAGSGETYYFMKGYGLVGFEATGFIAGLMGPGANPSGCTGGSGPPPGSPSNPNPLLWSPVLKVGCPDYKTNFHYLRPYPGNPMCDPLIPRTNPDAESDPNKKYNTLSCGNSLSGEILQDFDGYGDNGLYESLVVSGPGSEKYIHTWCDTRPSEANYICNTEDCTTGFKYGSIDCFRTITMDFNINLNTANLGILGNTQTDGSLPNVTKQNEYLSWYLSGPSTVDSRSTTNLGNDAGPVWKLLPAILKDKAQQAVRGSIGTEVHPVDNFRYQSSPITSMEDLAGEFIPYADKNNKPPEIVDPVCPSIVPAGPLAAGATCTAPYVVIPKSAIPAGH